MGQLTFYFDRTFGIRLPGALKKIQPPVNIKWHQDEGFPMDMDDDQWMGVVGPRKWIVLSQDRKWHQVAIETEAIKQHSIKCFYFPCASDPIWVSLGHFVRRFDKMCELAQQNNGPFVYQLKKNGQFYKVL